MKYKQKNEVQNILLRKSNEYSVTGLAINQNTDNLTGIEEEHCKN